MPRRRRRRRREELLMPMLLAMEWRNRSRMHLLGLLRRHRRSRLPHCMAIESTDRKQSRSMNEDKRTHK